MVVDGVDWIWVVYLQPVELWLSLIEVIVTMLGVVLYFDFFF